MATKKKERDGSSPQELTTGDVNAAGSEKSASAKAKEASKIKESAKPSHVKEMAKEKDKSDKAKEAQAKAKKKDDDEVELGDSLKDLRQFLKEVVIEFGKISWPPRQQVIKETWSVLFLVTVITLMVLGFDWFLGHAVFVPLEHWARLHGAGIGR
ncbi:MAG TPA: preprotein translocase subunit SecE [Candidatus Obscuribacterales bacterium]